MAMAVDNRNQQSHLNLPGYEGLRYQQQVPQFTNPWVNPATAAPSSHMYASATVTPPSNVDAARTTTLPMPAYGVPVTTASGLSADLLNRSYAAQYSSAPAATAYAQTSAPGYPMDYATSKSPQAYQQTFERRPSHPLNAQTTTAQRNSFSDAVDASRGMVSLSQTDMTPRNIYDVRNGSRSSTDSYGFPSNHSSHSSISSSSTYPSSYGYPASVAGSDVSDYSSASESVDLNSRTLPRPTNFPGGAPPPQSMMGQFSSKVSSSSQKKHKCKICDKRFTRPSSLQTHMYSHTGEKPFACEVEGCGRHFSVVSNLRRHRKVHKGEGHENTTSEED